MKKTLAAVLAAAMALSTASVAFATDFDAYDAEYVLGRWIQDETTPIIYGEDQKFRLEELTLEGGVDVDGAELATLVANGDITMTILVTQNANKLASKPVFETGRTEVPSGMVERETLYYFTAAAAANLNNDLLGVGGEKFTYQKAFTKPAAGSGDPVPYIPYSVTATGKKVMWGVGHPDAKPHNGANAQAPDGFAKAGTKAYRDIIDDLSTNYAGTYAAVFDGPYNRVVNAINERGIVFKLNVTHTYCTKDTTIGLKFRIKANRDGVMLGNAFRLNKGSTVTSEEYKFKARYLPMDNLDESMQLSLQEVKRDEVIFKGADLYDKIGNKEFDITFGDDVIFVSKASPSQKDMNLYYKLEDIADVANAYPEYDMDTIQFMGDTNGCTPTFVNSGKMYFNAINGDKTYVYEYNRQTDTLNPWPTNQVHYDSTYNVVWIDGVKRLTTFVVTEDILPDLVEETPSIQVPDDEPTVEPTVPDDESNGNPNTGAC